MVVEKYKLERFTVHKLPYTVHQLAATQEHATHAKRFTFHSTSVLAISCGKGQWEREHQK